MRSGSVNMHILTAFFAPPQCGPTFLPPLHTMKKIDYPFGGNQILLLNQLLATL